MRPSVTNTTTHTPPHTGGKGMCPDTQHILTQKIFFKEERCSRPLYSSHTPHPPPPTTTNSDQQTVSHKQEQPPTHHTTTVMQPAGTMCCPRHPTVHQQFTNVWNYSSYTTIHPTSISPARYVSTWIFHTTVAAPRSGTQPLSTHNCGPQNKAP